MSSSSFRSGSSARAALRGSLGALAFLILGSALSFAGPVPQSKPAHYPDWWFERDVILRLPSHATNPDPVWPTHYPAADDYAVANLGQLKFMATRAAAELDAQLDPPGAGADLHALLLRWNAAPPPNVTRDDFAALNQGQIKAIAERFYLRLASVAYSGPPLAPGVARPWTGAPGEADDFALANLGQIKHVFSFDPRRVKLVPGDGDADQLPDTWETIHFGSPAGQTGVGHGDADGLNNRKEFLLGTNPRVEALSASPDTLSCTVYAP